jgi:hypothetical protein
MLTDLTHDKIKKALVLCAQLGIGKNTKSVIEWAYFMGLPDEYWNGSKRHIIGNHIATSGKKLNHTMGYDYIAEHFPNWSNNPLYKSV